ncbi:hypothetical protein HD554DRAFT_2039844 [Boletus coccyginus]|nr:hypothetical protein HD554DRAFT_2039844 [Boletus coccyginus]
MPPSTKYHWPVSAQLPRADPHGDCQHVKGSSNLRGRPRLHPRQTTAARTPRHWKSASQPLLLSTRQHSRDNALNLPTDFRLAATTIPPCNDAMDVCRVVHGNEAAAVTSLSDTGPLAPITIVHEVVIRTIEKSRHNGLTSIIRPPSGYGTVTVFPSIASGRQSFWPTALNPWPSAYVSQNAHTPSAPTPSNTNEDSDAASTSRLKQHHSEAPTSQSHNNSPRSQYTNNTLVWITRTVTDSEKDRVQRGEASQIEILLGLIGDYNERRYGRKSTQTSNSGGGNYSPGRTAGSGGRLSNDLTNTVRPEDKRQSSNRSESSAATHSLHAFISLVPGGSHFTPNSAVIFLVFVVVTLHDPIDAFAGLWHYELNCVLSNGAPRQIVRPRALDNPSFPIGGPKEPKEGRQSRSHLHCRPAIRRLDPPSCHLVSYARRIYGLVTAMVQTPRQKIDLTNGTRHDMYGDAAILRRHGYIIEGKEVEDGTLNPRSTVQRNSESVSDRLGTSSLAVTDPRMPLGACELSTLFQTPMTGTHAAQRGSEECCCALGKSNLVDVRD